LPEAIREMFRSFALLEQAADSYRATVMLYPTETLYITSDLATVEHDVVYPAITPETQRFLTILPQQPCEYFLEMCAGTGIAALVAAKRYARHAWACDVTQRATDFAEFNCRLNGLENVTVLRGDLYQPVAGMTFDRIVAHPPYLPALRQQHVFRDGGEDGEQLTRAIIADLPRYLRPGGTFYCAALGSDRKSAPFEMRLRQMLGPPGERFDILLASRDVFTPLEYSLRQATSGDGALAELGQRDATFRRLDIERLLTCAILMRSRIASGAAVTIRRQMGPETANAEMEDLLEWEIATTGPAHLERLLDCKPMCSTAIRLRSTHVLHNQQWTLSECSFETDRPFSLRAQAPPWSAALVTRCDGQTTVRQHFRSFVEQGTLPQESSEQDFARFVSTLISGGFLTAPGYAGRERG
jgi:methylase of polypeptide subunit release factors